MQRVVLAGIVVLSSSLTWATDQFPYSAYVIRRSSSVLSGPGGQFYASDRVKRGDRVEVYHHEDTFAAIRPPLGSFSWVPAEFVEPTDVPDLMRITQSGVFSRVGSRFGSKHSAEYMPLEWGQTLEVLGQQMMKDLPEGPSRLWYKVAPVAGEFRWIRLSAIDRSPPTEFDDSAPVDPRLPTPVEEFASQPRAIPPEPRTLSELIQSPTDTRSDRSTVPEMDTATGPPTQEVDVFIDGAESTADFGRSESRGEITTITKIQPEALEPHRQPPDDSWQASPIQDPNLEPVQWNYDLSPRTGTDVVSRTKSTASARRTWREVAQFGSTRVASLPSISPVATSRAGVAVDDILPMPAPLRKNASIGSSMSFNRRNLPPVSRDYLRQELTEIDIKLANIVIEAPSQWALMPIQVRTQAVIDASHDLDIRDEAQSILAKINQFQDVQRRHRQMNRETNPIALGVNAPNPMATLSNTAPTVGATLYDGSGWLMPVTGSRKGMPRYVLTDDHGQVIQFVSPQPGLNLRQFVRQKIGVYGQKTNLPAYNRPHLMAERIVSLDIVGRR